MPGEVVSGGLQMHIHKLMLIVAAGAAFAMLSAAPGMTQVTPPAKPRAAKSYPIDPITGYPIPPGRKLVSNRPTARVTVTKRSYLDPGTESKPPNMSWSSFPADSPSGIFYDPTDWRVNFHNRTPFPNCLDLPGFCR
jgi:hypothetical protein